jgi:hypothetical protein
MKKFLNKIVVFLTIISSILLIINYFVDPGNLFSKSYETEMVEMLKYNNVTNISNFDERAFQRDFINSLETKPDILAIGSSRVVYIDSDFFKDKEFINSGVSGASLEDLVAIYHMYKFKGILPDEIILGVDPWIFNINNGQNRWLSIEKEYKKYYNKEESKINLGFTFLKYTQLFSPSYLQASLKLLRTEKKLTLTSQKNNYGRTKLKDGSLVENQSLREISINQLDYVVKDYIQGEQYSIEGFHQISSEKFIEFQNLCLDILESKIKLTFLLSPYHPLVYEKVKEDYDIVLDVENKIIEFANNKNIKLVGSYSPSKAGVSNKDFFDGLHLHKMSTKNILLD